jgi:crotonobetainyl-CoA:carnitine CoA-transferase CaiB-like acyl-CoA transferase
LHARIASAFVPTGSRGLPGVLTRFTTSLTKYELSTEGQQRGIPIMAVNTIEDLVVDAQLQARGYFASVAHPGLSELRYLRAPYRFGLQGWSLRRAAPRLGQDTDEVLESAGRPRRPSALPADWTAGGDGHGPLHGLRVIEMGWYVAAPWLGLQLARQGAEVIKIETRKRIDIMRQVPVIDGNATGADYTSFGGGKRSIRLDVRTKEGRRLMYELLRHSDVLIENFSLDAIRRFGLEWSDVHGINPRLVMVRMPGPGLEGPRSEWMSYGMAMSALSGLDHITGFPDGPPGGNSIYYPDYVAAMHGLLAVLVALDVRARNGQGQMIEISQFESAVSVLGSALLEFEANHSVRGRIGNHSLQFSPHGVYRAAGADRWIAVTVGSDEQWTRFAELIGEHAQAPEFRGSDGRKAHEAPLDALIDAWTTQHEAEWIVSELAGIGIAASIVATSKDILEDEQLKHRGFFQTLEVPGYGELPLHGPHYHSTARQASRAQRMSSAKTTKQSF